MSECLIHHRSPRDILQAQLQFRQKSYLRGDLGFGGATPCQQSFGPVQVFRGRPGDLIISNPVPSVWGSNKDEGKLFLALFIASYLKPKKLLHDYYYLKHQIIIDVLESLNMPEAQNETFLSEVSKSFFYHQELGHFNLMIPGLINLFSTYFIKQPTYDFAQANSKQQPTYYYSLDYVGSHTIYDVTLRALTESPPDLPKGVTHGDDLIYLFAIPLLYPKGKDRYVKRDMVTAWTHFAKTGQFGGVGRVPALGPITNNINKSPYLAFFQRPRIKLDFLSSLTARL